MGMALKRDVIDACRQAGTQKPIDLVFLSTLTMGDRDLEADILKMFASQLDVYHKMIQDCETHQDIERVAHSIKGVARSVGALRLAEMAKSAEQMHEFDHDAIKQEMREISDYIASISQ
ncbi:MAG: Hpt domain-containing protein [Pseudomonadota bacterium]